MQVFIQASFTIPGQSHDLGSRLGLKAMCLAGVHGRTIGPCSD